MSSLEDKVNSLRHYLPEAVANDVLPAVIEALNDLDQTRVQLAGCGVAALGSGNEVQKGDYGYSASFDDVRKLRHRFDRLLDAAKSFSYSEAAGLRINGVDVSGELKKVVGDILMEMSR